MKTILFFEWNSIGNEDICYYFTKMGFNVKKVVFDCNEKSDSVIRKVEAVLDNTVIFSFSFNYYPEISIACKELSVKYVSWVYDSPHINVYSYTVINECNYIFLFDEALYLELHNGGIRTVYYLPLAVNTDRMEQLDFECQNSTLDKDISFVGALYTESSKQLFDRMSQLDDYYRGYIDGLIDSQKLIYGANIIEDMLNEDVLAALEKVYPSDPDSLFAMSSKQIYSEYILLREVTSRERREAISRLGNKHTLDLYTHDKKVSDIGIANHGKIDYYDEMPYVFRTSKININISLRSIKTGIPLRVLDIMSNGGFLITNYQSEMDYYFEPGVDYVYYEDMNDLEAKVTYYLEHDDERKLIASNGCNKVRDIFCYTNAINSILDIVNGN